MWNGFRSFPVTSFYSPHNKAVVLLLPTPRRRGIHLEKDLSAATSRWHGLFPHQAWPQMTHFCLGAEDFSVLRGACIALWLESQSLAASRRPC